MAMDQTSHEAEGYFGVGSHPVLLIIAALVVIPYWKIWSRTGHSGGGRC